MEDGESTIIYPKVTQIIAIAEYYDVSVEYLLGLSDSKSYKDKYKVGSKEFGLSDHTMKFLELVVGGRNIPFPDEYNYDMTDYINYLILDFAPELLKDILSYFSILDEMEILSKNSNNSQPNQDIIDLDEKSLARKYIIVQNFERQLNSIRKEVKRNSEKKRKTVKQPSPYYMYHPFFRSYLKITDKANPPR